MRSFIRSHDDFFAGCMFLALGVGALLLSREYSLPGSREIGPGYFPGMLAGILSLIGAMLIARSLMRAGQALSAVKLKSVLPIVFGVLMFAGLLRPVGLLPMVVCLVFVGGLASARFKAKQNLVLGVTLAVVASLLFVKGLGLPMPVFGYWFNS